MQTASQRQGYDDAEYCAPQREGSKEAGRERNSDLAQARRESKSASLFFAKTMVTDRLAGLLAREMGTIPLHP